MSTETINYTCDFEMKVYDNGVLQKTIINKNVLTNEGKLIILARLCDATPPYNHLNHMVFGDSIYAATVLDVLDDFGYFYMNNTIGYKLNPITEDSVELFWELQESEYNGRWIKTVGLASDDYVFNRVVFPEIDYTFKMPSMKLVGKWIIRLTQD